MTELRVTVDGLDGLKGKLTPELLRGPVRDFLERAGREVEREAKERAVVDTGRLRSSITTRVETWRAIVGTNVRYAPFVEFGTRPHFPPPAALQPWARRHGLRLAWALARAIARRGTKPHPFMRPAFEALRGRLRDLLERLAADIARTWEATR